MQINDKSIHADRYTVGVITNIRDWLKVKKYFIKRYKLGYWFLIKVYIQYFIWKITN